MENLRALQSKLRRRLNELNASTSQLPPELLSRIFEVANVVDIGGKGKHAPLKLALVCSLWRDIIYSSPSLWQFLTVRLNGKYTGPPNTIRLVEYHAQNIGTLPMKLRIKYERNASLAGVNNNVSKDQKVPILTFFEQCFVACSKSLETLVLENVPRTWWPLLSSSLAQSSSYPVTQLKLSWTEEGSREELATLFKNNSAPHLNHVSLTGQRLLFQLPWSQLKFLRLHNLVISQCLDLLIACPGLIEFHCRSPTPSFHSTTDSFVGQLSHSTTDSFVGQLSQAGSFPRLERMSWEFGLNIWDTALMENARFPSLKHLSWRRYASGEFLAQAFQGISLDLGVRNRFVLSLRALTAFECSLRLWTIEELCSVLPSTLQELILMGDNLENRIPFCLEFLTLNNVNGNADYLPRLKVLGLPDLHVCLQPIVLMTKLLKFLRSRRPPAGGTSSQVSPNGSSVFLERLRFSLATPKETAWDQSQLDSLQEIIRHGLVLEASKGRKQDKFWVTNSIYS
ncbi:hypothetical protein NP233_g221 [Leucocoprinus birnbaumii]|uniref:F-box domain-containing protein n=1 Tax=Leucocoprinus birnbaumii TaxID=56174 RepID=A0AAD5Z0E8_9AGAR|nr:hypothetical protein NP233_g221 [Leucocoprinus birnbaumii]